MMSNAVQRIDVIGEEEVAYPPRVDSVVDTGRLVALHVNTGSGCMTVFKDPVREKPAFIERLRFKISSIFSGASSETKQKKDIKKQLLKAFGVYVVIMAVLIFSSTLI